VVSLPTNGETIYVRLMTNFSGTWKYVDSTYTAVTQGVLISPAPGSILNGPNITFSWTAATGTDATEYRLYLGSTGVGSNNLYSSALQTGTSFSTLALPTNGETIYARLITSFNGALSYTDYIYTAVTHAELTSPSPSGLLPGRTVTFAWSPATGGTAYELWLGSTGVGSDDLYNSLKKTVTSITVGGLPDNGETIYARVLTDFNGSWASADYTFTAVTAPVMSSPANTGLFAGPTVTFTWAGGVGVSAYELYIGSSGIGSNNLYNSGSKTVTSLAVSGLPTNGETINVRLLTNFNGSWAYSDYTYTAATHAVLATPAAGSTLAGAAVTFTLTPATGTEATAYELWLGSTGVGSNNLYNSGQTTATTFNVKSLPTNGETIYARVLTNFGGTWGYVDTTYVAQ
jgi:serine protease